MKRAFVGFKWLVTAITRDGQQTPILSSTRPVSQVYVLFRPNGEFGANDPVNFHQGTYSLTEDGFTTSGVLHTLVGYVGDNQTILVAMAAISAFNTGAHAKATVTGDRLVISVGEFVLDCQRDGPSGDGG